MHVFISILRLDNCLLKFYNKYVGCLVSWTACIQNVLFVFFFTPVSED